MGLKFALAVAIVLCAAAIAAAAIDGTQLVSRGTGAAGAAGNDPTSSSTKPSVSADGRYVAFETTASNLDPADTDGINDIYVRDTATGTTILVSRASGVSGAKGNNDSDHPSISDDGRYVAFRSMADNLHTDDPSGDVESDIFVRDVQANTTQLVSRVSGASGAKTNGFTPSISADGRYVAFDSFGAVETDDPTVEHDIHVRDLELGTTTMASKNSSGAPGDSNSYNPSISPSGRYVAFESQAANLDAADASPDLDVYVRDRQLGTTVLASRASGVSGAKANQAAGEAAMSDAPSVAFESYAANLHPDASDGRFSIFVRDLPSSTTSLVSRAAGASGPKGDGDSRFPSISADGRRVAFESSSAVLALPDTDAFNDAFVRDLQALTTTLVDVTNDGTQSDGGAHLVAISRDGAFAAFQSTASNLGPNPGGWQFFLRNVFGSASPAGGGAGAQPAGGGTAGGTGGTSTNAPPAAAAPAKANLAGAKAAIKVTRKGTFTFSFRASPGLKGKAVFRSAKPIKTSATRKRVTLASKTFTVPKSGLVKLQIKLSKKNLAILRKNRKIKTKVSVTLTNAAGLSSMGSKTITLKR